MIQPPGIALNWNIPICFFLCASTSDRVKIRTGLSDGEAVAWSHTVSTIQCHVHMLQWVYPHSQLSCDDSKTHRAFGAKREIQPRYCICWLYVKLGGLKYFHFGYLRSPEPQVWYFRSKCGAGSSRLCLRFLKIRDGSTFEICFRIKGHSASVAWVWKDL